MDADGNMLTIAGSGGEGNADGPAASASFRGPRGIAYSALDGSIYVADTGNHSVRRILRGVVSTVAGTGFPGYSGDGGRSTLAMLNTPLSVAATADGGLLILDCRKRQNKADNRFGAILRR